MRGAKRTLSDKQIVFSPGTANINILSFICIPHSIRWMLIESTDKSHVYHTRITEETEVVSYIDHHYKKTHGFSNFLLVCEALNRAGIPKLDDHRAGVKWWYSLSPQNWKHQQGLNTPVDVYVHVSGTEMDSCLKMDDGDSSYRREFF